MAVGDTRFGRGDSVELRRGACEGTCPVYTVVLRGNGTATYLGAFHAARIGRFTGAFAGDEFWHLMRLLDAVGFDDWADSYVEPVTCLPPYAISVARHGRTKTVEQYATDEPPGFWAVARIIDAIADGIGWAATGGSSPVGVPPPATRRGVTGSSSAPPAIDQVVQRWRSEGSPAQPPMNWPRGRWIRQLPAHSDMLRALPDKLDRAMVRKACEGAADGAEEAERALITVMAWGYGSDVGYGPWRTDRVLAGTPDSAARLAAVAETLAQGGAVAAYGRFARAADCRLHGLGPAFGTKFLYFCQPAGSTPTALILDRLVADWLARDGLLRLNPVGWSVATYRRYLEAMHGWAWAVGCTPDELECCIFRAMARELESQW